jgi:crotonobetaine/carnitine-CoA ligase
VRIDSLSPSHTVVDLLLSRTEEHPEAPWIFFDTDPVTRADALDNTLRAASALASVGVEPGDRVVTLLGNCPTHLWTILGAAVLNAIAVPLHFGSRGAQLQYYLDDADPIAVVTSAANAEACRPFLTGRRTLTVGGSAEGALDIDGLLAASDPISISRRPSASDPFSIMYTSGTTGPSKGVVNPHSQPMHAARYVAEAFGHTGADRIFTAQPLFHAAALWWCCFSMLWAGGSVSLASRFRPDGFWHEIADSGATSLKAVMAMLLQSEEALSDRPLPEHTVDFALVTPMPSAAVQRRLENRFNLRLASNYGMTELHAVAVRSPDLGEAKPGSAGRVCDHDEVTIVDASGAGLPVGSIGEITVRPRDVGAMFSGYWRNDEATVKAWQDLWFRTGDLGHLDDEGFLWFAGRTKLAIRRKGENISTNEVEQVLTTHPSIAHSAVVGVPSEDGEHEVAAFIVRTAANRNGSERPFSERDVVNFAVENMSPNMVPRFVKFLDSLPQTETCKTNIALLASWAQAPETRMWDRRNDFEERQ